MDNGYLVYNLTPRSCYNAINAYVEVDNPDEWLKCPNCNLKPIVREFDNGRSTSCGCGENDYKHFSIHAESILSVMANSDNGQSFADYDSAELKNNWNHWVQTGEILFNKRYSETGRW